MQASFFTGKIFLSAVLSIYCAVAEAQNAADTIKKGDEFFKKEKFDPAINSYTKAISIDPRSYEAFYKRALIYATIRQNSKALKDYTNAISLAPADPKYKALLHAERGNVYKNNKLFDSAWLDFNKALSFDPGNVNAYSGRGDVYYQKNSFDSALLDYTKAISLNSTLAESYRKRSKAYYCRNQADSALNDMLIAMRFDSAAANYNYRGLYYNSLGNYEPAVKDFLTTLKNDFKSGNSYINIISPLVRLQRFAEASVFYTLYLDRFYLAEVLAKKGVLLSFGSFLDQTEYNFYNYYVKAVTQVADGKLTDALASLDTASKKYGSEIKNLTKRCYIDILHLRGYILEKLGRLEEAKINFEQSLIIDPRQPDVTAALGDLNIKQKDALVKTRAIDKTAPVINVWSADTLRSKTELKDTIRIKVRGKATDVSGISTVKINEAAVGFDETDGYFEYTLMKNNRDSADIVITVTDSANVTGKYVISNKKTRGGVMENSMVKQEGPGGNYYAILVAETDYINPDFDDLNFPIRDADRLKEILVSKYTFEAKNIDTLYNRSREDIVETIIAKCKALDKNDNLLIFYAGHGDTGRYKTGYVDGYLIPTSAKKGLVSYYITSGEIQKALLNSNGKHILIMLDACYSGQFLKETDEEEDKLAVKGDEEAQWKALSRKVMTSGNLAPVPDDSYFIKYVQEFLKENKKPYASAKDLWNSVKNKMNSIPEADKTKYHNPQYSALKSIGDEGGSFIFKLRQ